MRARYGLYATAASVAVLALGAGSAVFYTYGERSGAVKMEVSDALTAPAPVSPLASPPASGPAAKPEEPQVYKFGSSTDFDKAAAESRFGFTGKAAPSPGGSAAADQSAVLEERMMPAEQQQVQTARANAESPAAPGRRDKAIAGKVGLTASPATVAPNAPGAQPLPQQSAAGAGNRAVTENLQGFAPNTGEDTVVVPTSDDNRNQFEAAPVNPVKQVAADPVSTFSIDVDTASYSFVRRALNAGRLPQKDAVRVEEMINYFPYAYPTPEKAETPFQASVTVTPAPWNPANKLLHIGIKGYEIRVAERPRANLVFLIDVSGSMQGADRLDLVKNAFRMLVDELKPDDTVGIVTYAGESGIALEPTKVSDKGKILRAIEKLGAGGSTAGAEGINDAYRLAEASFDKTGVNRVILATDGDFNVGITNPDELEGFIERKRASGIFLSILGVGQGNYNDALMQSLAQNGNGTAAYADTLNEARKVLVDEASSTLFTIAKDVKIQVEFNPALVSEYRLIGYETRALKREDFNNDKVDAGDIGSGHTVTAIYEFTPTGAPKLIDDLRYGKKPDVDAKGEPLPPPAAAPCSPGECEYAFLKLRYKLPKEDESKLVTVPVTKAMERADISAAPEDARFSVAVAAFGQLLRGQPYTKSYSFDDVLALAQTARGQDPFGYRAEFLNLVRLAKSVRP